jgi:glycosyltransferase involved in cell wall biosynthesis
MRVLVIAHSFVTRSNHQLLEQLSRFDDLQLELLAPPWWPEESRIVHQEKTSDPQYTIRQARIAYWRQPMPNLFAFREQLGQALREFQPDILDIQEEPFSLVMGQILTLRRMVAPRARVLFYSFQNLLKHYPPPFRQIEQWAFRAAPIACIASSEIGQVLQRKGYRGRLDYSPPGVDPAIFCPQPEQGAALRGELGIPPNQPLLGYLGRLTPEKGVDDLLAALTLLPPAVRLLIIGGGEQGALETRATALGVRHRIHFSGAINRLDAPSYLSALNLLLVPSRTTPRWKEQFGRVIVEAALCGVPVIGSDSGAIPEVVGPGGLIVPEGNVRALANAIQLIIDQPQLAAALAERGQARALSEFTWERVAAGRMRVYHELMEHVS